MKRKYVIGGIAMLLLVAALWAYREFNRERVDSKNVEPKFRTEAIDLLREFTNDEKLASQKYSGQDIIIAVSGNIKEIVKNENGYQTILIGDLQGASSVRCLMDTLYSDAANQLQQGQRVRMKGNFNGYKSDDLGIGADIELNFCVLDSPAVKK